MLRAWDLGILMEIPCLYSAAAAAAQETKAASLSISFPLDVRPLKAAYSW
jgi:hypothetical protein